MFNCWTFLGKRYGVYCEYLDVSEVLCQKQVSRAGRSNYTPEVLWDVITCPCPWCLLLVQHFWYMITIYRESAVRVLHCVLSGLGVGAVTIIAVRHVWYFVLGPVVTTSGNIRETTTRHCRTSRRKTVRYILEFASLLNSNRCYLTFFFSKYDFWLARGCHASQS